MVCMYVGTEDFLIRKDVATHAILEGYTKNPTQLVIYDTVPGLIDFMTAKIQQKKPTMYGASAFKPITIDGNTFLVTELQPREFVFLNSVVANHLFANGFKICFQSAPNGASVHIEASAIMRDGQVVGVILPVNVSTTYLTQIKGHYAKK